MNGGAWLTIKGQRVDFLYRDLIFTAQIIQECKKGLWQFDFYQQPPFGFHSYIYCAEIETCQILSDPQNIISKLKSEVDRYPQALKKAIINDFLWDAEFSLEHCKKSARRGEILTVAGCLTRIVSDFIQVLYALNEVYFISEKKLFRQEASFRIKPINFSGRIEPLLGKIGHSVKEMERTVSEAERLFKDVLEIVKDKYRPRFRE